MNIYVITETNISIYFLYRVRKILKLSARKAHELFGMKYSSYYKLEKYDHNLPLERLFFVLNLFNLNLCHLQQIIDLVKSIIDSNQHLILGWSSELQIELSEASKAMMNVLSDGELTFLDDVEHFDDVLGYKAVAEIDEFIHNLIKDHKVYKEVLQKNKGQ